MTICLGGEQSTTAGVSRATIRHFRALSRRRTLRDSRRRRITHAEQTLSRQQQQQRQQGEQTSRSAGRGRRRQGAGRRRAANDDGRATHAPADADSRRHDAQLPDRRAQLARAPLRQRHQRHSRRRDGPRQNAPDNFAARLSQRSSWNFRYI
jgi:hypothetical protein